MNAHARDLTIVQQVTAVIDPIKHELPFMLPPTIPMEKFKAVFMTAAMTSPGVLKGNQDGLRKELMKCASDGLLPDGRQSVLILFKGQPKYMPMVQGIITRARELGDLFSVTAECVYEADTFKADLSDPSKTEHVGPSLDVDRGKIIGAYAIFRAATGAVIHREILTRSDIDKIKSKSLTKNDGVWGEWEPEMARKSAIRRGIKYVPVSSALRTIITRDDDMVDLSAPPLTARHNPLVAPVEAIEPETLGDRIFHALSLCKTQQELDEVISGFDAEISEADATEKEKARLLFNVKGKEIAAKMAADQEAREANEELAKSVTAQIQDAADMATMAAAANDEKEKVAALPDDLKNPIYALYQKRRVDFEKNGKDAA
jgi:phage RecT family recombinase